MHLSGSADLPAVMFLLSLFLADEVGSAVVHYHLKIKELDAHLNDLKKKKENCTSRCRLYCEMQ